MSEAPQTWHHGLVARWWAEFNTDGPEIAYFQALIERYGQPALDVACGTGRLLLPYLRAGLDVDGCDLSPDMLALCRERAAREGLAPNLYAQAMHALDLPHRYRTIYMCGALGLGGDRAQDQQALRRHYDLLEPGGVLAFDHHLPYGNPGSWRYWVKERRQQLPVEWPSSGERKRAADGTELELMTRMVALDPLAQRWTSEIRVGQWRGEELLALEEYALSGNLYFKNEVALMLEQAGFRDVRTYGAYTEREATPDDDILVHIATK
jgi:SAM-dependent methyltransferase